MEIQVRALRKLFLRNNEEPLLVLDGIDFTIEHGQFVTIIGPSGCGKTTLLKIIAGIEKADSGGITPDPSVRDGGFPIVWQEHRLFPWRTVMGNVMFPLEVKNLERSRVVKKAQDLIQLMGLNGFEDYYPWQISLGMAQRVAIARALVTGADCLLMDEPFASVDYQTKQLLFQQLRQLQKEKKLTILYVTHDLRDAIRNSDYVVVLSNRPARVREIMNRKDTSMPEFVLERRLWDLLR